MVHRVKKTSSEKASKNWSLEVSEVKRKRRKKSTQPIVTIASKRLPHVWKYFLIPWSQKRTYHESYSETKIHQNRKVHEEFDDYKETVRFQVHKLVQAGPNDQDCTGHQ